MDDAALLGGTLPYLSPEVLAGRTAAEADDVWSLSVVLYEMAAGRHPFAGGALEEVQRRIGAPAPLCRRACRIRRADIGDGRGRLRGVDPDGPPGGAAGDRTRLRRGAGRSLRERVAKVFSNYFQPACPVLSCHTSLNR